MSYKFRLLSTTKYYTVVRLQCRAPVTVCQYAISNRSNERFLMTSTIYNSTVIKFIPGKLKFLISLVYTLQQPPA